MTRPRQTRTPNDERPIVTEAEIREKLERRIRALTGQPDYKLPPATRPAPVRPPDPDDDARPTPDQIREHLARRLSDSDQRWRKCPNPLCRRVKHCAGEAAVCFGMSPPG